VRRSKSNHFYIVGKGIHDFLIASGVLLKMGEGTRKFAYNRWTKARRRRNILLEGKRCSPKSGEGTRRVPACTLEYTTANSDHYVTFADILPSFLTNRRNVVKISVFTLPPPFRPNVCVYLGVTLPTRFLFTCLRPRVQLSDGSVVRRFRKS
jgi:hypothetical protein